MEAVAVLVLFVAGCIIVLRGFAFLISQATTVTPPHVTRGNSGIVAPSAEAPVFARRNYFFSAAERSFYEILCRLTPEHTVFAKVRLSDLVRVQASGREFWERFNSINGKHVDFVLCDKQLAPVVAIELDDSSHDTPKRRVRDKAVDAVLESASLPIVHVRAKRGYVLDEIRQLLAPYLRFEAPTIGKAADYIPVRSWQPNI